MCMFECGGHVGVCRHMGVYGHMDVCAIMGEKCECVCVCVRVCVCVCKSG